MLELDLHGLAEGAFDPTLWGCWGRRLRYRPAPWLA